MGNKKIKFNLNTDMQIHREIDNRISMRNFIELHEDFIADKELEGLAERTLDDYTINLNYFRNYVEGNIQSDLNRVAIDVNIFKNYIYFMLQEKEYSPFTINIRLRTLKCYRLGEAAVGIMIRRNHSLDILRMKQILKIVIHLKSF